jgi:Sugar (and other) transporter
MQWLFQFVIARATPYMISNIGYGTYLFFASCTLLMAIWEYFCVPETKGRTLESMDQLFGAETVRYENELTEDEIQEKSASFHREGMSVSVENKA